MLRRNAALKITSLLLALFLWFYVRLTQENPFVEKTLRLPVAIRDPRRLPDGVERFDEESVKLGKLGHMRGAEFIETVIGIRE